MEQDYICTGLYGTENECVALEEENVWRLVELDSIRPLVSEQHVPVTKPWWWNSWGKKGDSIVFYTMKVRRTKMPLMLHSMEQEV